MPEQKLETEEILSLLSHLLCDYKPRISDDLNVACEEYPGLREVVEIIYDIRLFTASLSQGEFDGSSSGQGYVLSNLKALQSNFHHLIWQLTQVSKGDFSQRVDFLGEVSESFNAMCEHLEKQQSFLTELAQYDVLTKLANRYYLDQYLDGIFERSQAIGTVFSLMMIDLDFFKKINDTHGHDVGDIVLERVSEYFQKAFRTTDFIARYGGEEFVAVLPGTNKEKALSIAERACTYFVENPIKVSDDLSIPLTISIGVTVFREDDETWEQMIKRSDTALYKAKSAGRNRYEFL